MTNLSRRRALQWSAGLLAGVWTPPRLLSAAPKPLDLTIKKIDRVTVRVPYREIPQRAMSRELPHWKYSELFTVQLASGHRGHGETLLYYTWGATRDDDVRRAGGRNAAKLMWDDSLGAGLQMALFDAVAKASGVPIHQLLGNQLYETTPLSWWNIDTSADDMAAECAEAHRQGYMAYKTKGRPWFDIHEQLDKATKVVPPEFKIDMDFNDTLLTAKQGIPILKDLEKHPQVDIYETPIPQGDIRGNQEIRKATRVNIAMHYGNPPPLKAIEHGVCDGFVIGGGATRVMRQAAVAETAEMPFWLQLVGTGVTAAFSLHFGAVCRMARWPAVNCHQLYQHTLLKEPIAVNGGFSKVPAGPGLGVEIDWDVVEKYRVDKPKSRPEPERLIEVAYPSGKKLYVGSPGRVNFMINAAKRGLIPFYEKGADTRLVPDDGTADWKELYRQARRKPVWRK